MKKSAEKESRRLRRHERRDVAFEEYVLRDEPFYLPVAHEVEIFEAAHARRLPILLKGPTGLRQDAVSGVHVLSLGAAAADHRRLP